MPIIRVRIEGPVAYPWQNRNVFPIESNLGTENLGNGNQTFVGWANGATGEFFQVEGIGTDAEGQFFRVTMIDTKKSWPGCVWLSNPKPAC